MCERERVYVFVHVCVCVCVCVLLCVRERKRKIERGGGGRKRESERGGAGPEVNELGGPVGREHHLLPRKHEITFWGLPTCVFYADAYLSLPRVPLRGSEGEGQRTFSVLMSRCSTCSQNGPVQH